MYFFIVIILIFFQSDDLVRVYPPYVNFFEMSKDALLRCDKMYPRFHAFLKVESLHQCRICCYARTCTLGQRDSSWVWQTDTCWTANSSCSKGTSYHTSAARWNSYTIFCLFSSVYYLFRSSKAHWEVT